MSEMKLIMEKWNKCLAEATTEPPQFTPEQLAALKRFLVDVVTITQAIEDTPAAPVEEGRAAGRRARRIARNKSITRIKKAAELVGIKRRDFTDAQKALYKEKQAEIAAAQAKNQEKSEAETNFFLNTVANGNILEVPGIKSLVALGGAPLRAGLAGLVGMCANNLTLTCLANWGTAQAQGAGE